MTPQPQDGGPRVAISRNATAMPDGPVRIERGDVPDRAQPSPKRAYRLTCQEFNCTPRRFWRLRHRARRDAASVIAVLMGDPPRGRSALDRREVISNG